MEQKKFDYNSFIGMILLGGIMIWYLNTNKPSIESTPTTSEQQVDTVNNKSLPSTLITSPSIVSNDSIKELALQNKFGAFATSAINGVEGKLCH